MKIFRFLPVLLLAACATQSAIDTSQHHARVGEYIRAFEVLDEIVKEQSANGGTVDESLATAHAAARLQFLRSRAQQHIFQERENDALVDLAELEALAPDYPGLKALRARASHKRAMRLVGRGEEYLMRKDFVGALAAFYESDKILPGLDEATDGMDRVREATSRLTVRAQEQFLEAIRKLPELRFIEVQYHAGNVIYNAPNRLEAKALQTKAQRENALKAMATGRECESEGRFGAALLDYKSALELDASVPGAPEAILAMTREMQAAVLVDRAQVDMRAGRFDDARAALGEAFELSLMSRNDIGALVLQTKKLEGEKRYQNARDLEVLGKKSEALAAFEALAKDWPEGLSDEQARVSALRGDIEGAGKEWTDAEAAEAASDLPKALDHYTNSERYYPNWRDGKARIVRLREAIAKPPGGGENGGGQGNG